MINSKIYIELLLNLIDNLYDSQEEKLEEMAMLISDCIAKDGVVHVFGTGHSVGLGIDIKGREGALVPIHIMDMTDFVTKGVIPLSVFKSKTDIFERKPGVAKDLYELYDIRKEDIFIVISNSGINGIVIDIAMLAKQNGHKVITVTSMQHTLSEDSRHPTGKKMYEFGDVVIDNCGPHGDAFINTDSIEKVCSVSSICNNLIAQSVAARVVQILIERRIDVPIITSDIEKNNYFFKKYEGRI